MIEVDLHGVKHEEVQDIILSACYKYQIPFVVITGKSSTMKRIVSFAASKIGYIARDTIDNPGRVVIDENR